MNDGELRMWAKQVKRALYDVSITKVEDAALIRPDIYTRKPRRNDSPFRPHGDYLVISAPCASWTSGRQFTIELYRDGRVHWNGPDASVREMYLHLRKQAPRWRVPPQGGPAMCVVLREHNGWEGESWRYAFPIEHEAAALELVNLHEPSQGQDMRVTPLCPRSMAHFGSWSLELNYLREEDAQHAADNSRTGYMAYHNFSETAGAELDALLKQAKESGLDFWQRDSSKGGVSVWKARVRLSDNSGKELTAVDLSC